MIQDAVRPSILGRAQSSGAVQFRTSSPRDFATDKHRTVDDTPYGGGPGMVMRVDVVADALRFLAPPENARIILTDPRGERFNQKAAEELANANHIIFLCGHYEGIDERVRVHLATDIFTIGDYVLTGGELPALVMCDAVVRLLPGVLGDEESHRDDSHSNDGLLGFPLYTRPADWEGHGVPEVLKQGDHGAIARWRRREQLRETRVRRPDLFARADLTADDIEVLS
ncbi:MAG: tRNA (guanosine(37)-N1)-methyltransferase TrmD [Fimbriimonadaceae bacterium]|nr:tRNA (guanosine(37)-N1)-methyltransferase TrmD [Fimbriimonadaceae bacterium]